MKHISKLIFSAIALTLEARENPFLPTDINVNDINTSNIGSSLPPFSSTSLHLPSSARELVKVVLIYKSIDGSEHSQVQDAEFSIDWRDEFVLSRRVAPKISTNLDAPATRQESNIAKAQSEENMQEPKDLPAPVISEISADTMIAVNNADNKPAKQSKANKALSKDELASKYTGELITAITPSTKALGSSSFQNRLFIESFDNKIVLHTADTKIKHEIKGSKVIIDFAKKGRDYLTKSVKFKSGPLKRAVIGSHGKFYRVVLYLKNGYKYSLREGTNNYTLWLNK